MSDRSRAEDSGGGRRTHPAFGDPARGDFARRSGIPATGGSRNKSIGGARRALAAALTAVGLVAAAGLIANAVSGAGAAPQPRQTASPAAGSGSTGWTGVDYGQIVDGRRLSHSGESVGSLLQNLKGRPAPPAARRSDDAISHVLLDPLLEPYAFVLPDVLDSITPVPGLPLVDVGGLWHPGETQPAWVELVRARRYVVESDGGGRLRICVPWTPRSADGAAVDGSTLPEAPSEAAAEEAWSAAWPVLRHVLAAERRRLARAAGDRPENHPLDVEVHPYTAYPARTLFHLGLGAWRTKVEDTGARGERAPLDLGAWQEFLDKGLRLEGARLEPGGGITLIGSGGGTSKTGLLGRPIALSDFAVAYRAVFHGGAGEPYMSLDRGGAPQAALVNYGGRLRDTSLGLVSLLCDVRFKTFSQGIDVIEGRDVRERVRKSLPGFRTHLERFAADAGSQSIPGQQTRLWFYPDSVDLVLSQQGDALLMRRARMSAASERLQLEAPGSRGGTGEPPWTLATVSAINADYDALARDFPELADLDQVVRLLSFFTWLRQARADGLDVPDLDVLLAVDLPEVPTPRRFPHLLAYSAMPAGGAPGVVDVFDRHPVASALDRLLPRSGAQLPAARRFRRALAALDRHLNDHAALAREIEGTDTATLDEGSLDILSYRAERLRMHQLVLNTLSVRDRELLDRRRSGGEALRTISTGIGGLDLGMSQALERATRRSGKGTLGGEAEPGVAAGSGEAGGPGGVAGEPPVTSGGGGVAGASGAGSSRERPHGPIADSALLPATQLPEHGLAAAQQAAGAAPSGRAQPSGFRAFGGSWVQTGRAAGGATGPAWIQVVLGADRPEPQSRRLILDDTRHASRIERVEDGRFVRYRIDRQGSSAKTVPAGESLPAASAREALGPASRLAGGAGDAGAAAGGSAAGSQPPATPPEGLVLLEIGATAVGADTAAGADRTETASIKVRIKAPGGRELEAGIPRAVLERLVLGHEADLAPDKPLPGFSPSEKILGGLQRLMVTVQSDLELPPWAGAAAALPGEEDPVTIASALERWWENETQARIPPTVVVGTDAARSPGRWTAAPPPPAKALLLLPDGAFPGPAAGLREKLVSVWKGGDVVSSLPAGRTTGLVVLVSAEAPGLLGDRLRRLARDPAMSGKTLAVWPLGGAVRADLPASLLAEGNLAAVGLADWTPIGLPRTFDAIASLGAALSAPGAQGRRVEDLPGRLLWFY